MMTTFFLSQTLAAWPNSRLNTPMVPGPQTSCVMSTSTLTQTLSPGATCALPLARASSFSVSVISMRKDGKHGPEARAVQMESSATFFDALQRPEQFAQLQDVQLVLPA